MNRYDIDHLVENSKFICRKNLEKSNILWITRGFSICKIGDYFHNIIYLDGAFKGPLFNPSHKIYSLDHHENCIRQITKSTCEQALLFAKFGTFDNNKFDIIGNDPDLDTILAGWILLNIDEIQKEDVFRKILPLVLIAGNVDTYGIGYEEMTGLSKDTIFQEKNRIDWLRKEEIKLKETNEWNNIDFTEYTLSILNKIDEFVFFKSNDIILDIKNKKELLLKNNKKLVYIEDRRLGIYDAEILLKDNKDIVCIILSNEADKFTIKLTNLLSDFSLDFVWIALSNAEMLEKINKGITADNNPQLYFTDWGGSLNIGGSPRYFDGRCSFLTSDQITTHVLNELNIQLMK